MANSMASGSSTGRLALTRSVKAFMARRVAGVHAPLSSPFVTADALQLLLQLARQGVTILGDWAGARRCGRRLARALRDRDDDGRREGGYGLCCGSPCDLWLGRVVVRRYAVRRDSQATQN